MRLWATVLLILAFGSVLWAQTVTTTVVPATSAGVVCVPNAATTTVIPGTAVGPICPSTAVALPQPCPVAISQSVTGQPIILILGSEETMALNDVQIRNLNYTNVSGNYTSVFEEGNPLSYMQVNGGVTRHGNPYYPYYAVGTANVAGLQEIFVSGMSNLSATDRNTLNMVATRYRGLTPAQAMTLGYQPVGAFTPGMGQVYVNQALLSAPFNTSMPQAFVFDRNGKLAGVQYYVASATPVTIFGQPAVASTIVPGAQQVTVWLYSSNPNGRFAATNPRIK